MGEDDDMSEDGSRFDDGLMRWLRGWLVRLGVDYKFCLQNLPAHLRISKHIYGVLRRSLQSC